MKNLFLSVTGHHQGKTVIALGLGLSLSRRGRRVAYMKPIGHGNVEIGENRMDADATLMREACELHAPLTDMAPVVLEGFPTDLMTKEGHDHVLERIKCGLQKVGSNREFVLIEGSGNAATGAAFGLSNSFIAKFLDARVIIISSGGVGQPTDEVILNKCYYDQAGVPVVGVIVNKVYPHEFDRIKSFMKPVLESMNLKLLGAIPYDQDLARPTMRGLLEEFHGKVLNGGAQLNGKLGRFVLGAHSVATTLDLLQGTVTLLCPSDREDILLASLASVLAEIKQDFRLQGVIFAGKHAPDPRLVALLKRTRVPAIQVELDAYSLASMIHSTPYRLSSSEGERLRRAEELVTKHVDVDLVLAELEK
ncbi:MAG: AAA family ATPase [Planctomycetes bacterium]|nr:AAA family ATPase [Planctomycetota bacterium]